MMKREGRNPRKMHKIQVETAMLFRERLEVMTASKEPVSSRRPILDLIAISQRLTTLIRTSFSSDEINALA